MAKFTGAATVFDGDSTTNGSTTLNTLQLGTRARTGTGNEYIFLQGTASVAYGDFVAYNPISFTTTRLLSGQITAGPVALAGTAVVLNQSGWFLIYGCDQTVPANVATDANAALGSALYASSTAGRATTTSAAGKLIFGAVAGSTPASNTGTVFLNYPFINGTSTV